MRITQVCNNFISNAVKFAYPSTTVDIKAEYESFNQKLKVSVIGDSLPIKKEEQQFLFKPYVQLSNNLRKEGKGLGLYISKEIVQQLDGNIGYESS